MADIESLAVSSNIQFVVRFVWLYGRLIVFAIMSKTISSTDFDDSCQYKHAQTLPVGKEMRRFVYFS